MYIVLSRGEITAGIGMVTKLPVVFRGDGDGEVLSCGGGDGDAFPTMNSPLSSLDIFHMFNWAN